MKSRKDRLARAMAIGDKLWRMEQMRLSAAEAEVSALRAAEVTAFEALGHIEPSFVLSHLSDLSKKRVLAEQALLQAKTRVQDQGRRLKLTEKLYKEAERRAQTEETAERLRQMSNL